MKSVQKVAHQKILSSSRRGTERTSTSISNRGYIELTSSLEILYVSPDLDQLGLESVRIGASIFCSFGSPDQAAIAQWTELGDSLLFEATFLDPWGNPFEAVLSRSQRRISVYLRPVVRKLDATDELSPDVLTQLLNLSSAIVGAFSREGEIYAANDAWRRLFQPLVSETDILSYFQRIVPGAHVDFKNHKEAWEGVCRGGSIAGWISIPSGSSRWIQWRLKRDESRGLDFLIGVDETEARASELFHETVKAEFELQHAGSSVGITQTDFFGRYVSVNDGFCRLVGYTAQELKGLRFSDITHPEDIFSDAGRSELLVAGEIDRFSMEKRYIRKDGQIVWALATVTLIRDENWAPKLFLSAVVDIDSRTSTDSTLRQSEEYFHSLIDPNDRTYWTADANGVVLEISRNGGLMTGVERESLVNDQWQKFVQSEDRTRVLKEWSNSIASGKDYQCEYRVETVTGDYRWVRSRALPHRDASGEILCWYGSTDDIQTQKITENQLALLVEERTQELLAANEALTEARDLAQAASLAKSQFLANMSHEIRTPMNGVIGIASLLREQELDPKCRAMVDIICQSGENLIKIIGDILDFSKLEAGRVVIEATPTDFVELVSEVTALFQGHARFKQLDLRLEVKPASLPVLICDPLRMRQILSNLISNAIKFTTSGSVWVRLDGKVVENSFQLTLEVEDEGIGISSEAMKSIFESFTQGDGSTQRKYGGTGLGLAISKNLVDLMGGTLTAESVVGKGTNMKLHLTFHLAESSHPQRIS